MPLLLQGEPAALIEQAVAARAVAADRLGMIGDGQVGVAARPRRTHDLGERGDPVPGQIRVQMQVALDVRQRHRWRQPARRGGIDLACPLPRRRRDERQPEPAVELGLVHDADRRAIRVRKPVRVQPQSALGRPAGELLQVPIRARGVKQRGREPLRRHHVQPHRQPAMGHQRGAGGRGLHGARVGQRGEPAQHRRRIGGTGHQPSLPHHRQQAAQLSGHLHPLHPVGLRQLAGDALGDRHDPCDRPGVAPHLHQEPLAPRQRRLDALAQPGQRIHRAARQSVLQPVDRVDAQLPAQAGQRLRPHARHAHQPLILGRIALPQPLQLGHRAGVGVLADLARDRGAHPRQRHQLRLGHGRQRLAHLVTQDGERPPVGARPERLRAVVEHGQRAQLLQRLQYRVRGNPPLQLRHEHRLPKAGPQATRFGR